MTCIAICAPATPITSEDAARVEALAKAEFPQLQLDFHPQCFADGGHFAGPDEMRLGALLACARSSADFVWFAETGTGYTGRADSPLLGVHQGRAIYLLYNGILKDKTVAGGNVLTGPVFDLLPTFHGPKVVYAAANRMGARAAREGVTFKQTPYALEL